MTGENKRQYQMRQRAQAQEQTRQRITEAAVELHGTLGPAQTSMSAVAERAGVRRSTLYRHFPDEAALFDACSSHWAAANPLPDLARWAAIASPDERLETALSELYDFYERTEGMLDNLFRDEPISRIVKERFGAVRAYFADAHRVLWRGRRLRGSAAHRTKAAIGHVLSFATWKSLVREQGLTGGEAVALMSGLVAAASERR